MISMIMEVKYQEIVVITPVFKQLSNLVKHFLQYGKDLEVKET